MDCTGLDAAFHLDSLPADLDIYLAQLSSTAATSPSEAYPSQDARTASLTPTNSVSSSEETPSLPAAAPRPNRPTGFLDPSKPRLALDAPIQPRSWVVPATTSRKRLSVPMERRLAKRRAREARGDGPNPIAEHGSAASFSGSTSWSSSTSSTSPPDIAIDDNEAAQGAPSRSQSPTSDDVPSEILSAVERKRRQNTLSARRCRARKQERVQELERENEGLRQRIRELEELLAGR
ncbi:hypothetical protein JCM10908_005396 [Rhodotorula pacifica]|uniref:bZIP transcription factor n=1 Tax=Rhodotorula pacifica TaxID=1495444 RepID=UPI00317A0E4E